MDSIVDKKAKIFLVSTVVRTFSASRNVESRSFDAPPAPEFLEEHIFWW